MQFKSGQDETTKLVNKKDLIVQKPNCLVNRQAIINRQIINQALDSQSLD